VDFRDSRRDGIAVRRTRPHDQRGFVAEALRVRARHHPGPYDVLEPLARNRVNLKKTETWWPDMLRVADSLEYGRIAESEHPMRMVDPADDTYRRQVNRRLTVQESRHKPARDVCHGKRGTIHQAYRDGMEDQLARPGPQRHHALDDPVHRRGR
jgi:TnpA family transposase